MRYSLDVLDRLVGDPYGEDMGEVKAILGNIKKTAFGLLTVEEIGLFIRNHQLSLQEKKKLEPAKKVADKVLHFLETYFPDYIDRTAPLSDLGKSNINARYSGLLDKTGPELKSILSAQMYQSILPILDPGSMPVFTVHQAKYLDQFWRNWIINFEGDEEPTVVDYLLAHNFNTYKFYRASIYRINTEAQKTDSPFS